MTVPSWNLSVAYQGLDDSKIEQDIELVNQCLEVLRSYQNGRDQVSVMQNAIQTNEAAGKLLATISTYANCITSVDSSATDAKALLGRIAKLSAELTQAFTPYQDSLIQASESFVDDVLNHASGDVAGQAFAIRWLRKQAKNRLSIEQEQLLSAMEVDGRDAWGKLYDNVTGTLKVDVKYDDGRSEQLGFSQAASVLYGTEFERQQPVWEGIQRAMATHKETFAAILNAISGWRLTEYQKRSKSDNIHFLEPSLHQSRITLDTLDAMMECANDNKALGQKAGRLMAKVHGLSEMKPWNHLAGMPAKEGEQAKVYPFEEAIELIKAAFEKVSPEMSEFVDTMIANGWIDAASSENRRLGAYCTKFAATRSPLVFMTWGGSRSDLLTLAHELGHAFHNWVMRDLPLCKTRYPMTLAETASIFAENIVRDYLLDNASSDGEKLEMLWEELSSCYALTINIPVRFEFERAFYQRRSDKELTADELCDLMSETWQRWYGDSMTESDPYFWASKLHFSLSSISFYNYPYLFGYLFSAGVYAQREVKGSSFYLDYLNLLRDTGSMTAEEVVEKHMAMDLSKKDFWQQSFDRVSKKIDYFESLLDSQ
ncbi:M3 family oligoendopeptidase [Vibrio sonorensis]|uniref:M3 family oligoendopeptidase n=1 Tax=Vibrio sonorensis TaxID=1004316 RepID=UPI0008D9733E|nr:M3 family oligoendopeptidase [Vibrio sonorensis]